MRPAFILILVLLCTGIPMFWNSGFSAQEQGEILLSPSGSEKKTSFSEKPAVQEEKPLPEKKEKEVKNNHRKILFVYIASGVCLLYLLMTYRSRKRRI